MERRQRFDRFAAAAERPWQFVFGEAEAARAMARPDPATALCAAFCVKEAFLKAIGTSYDYTACVLHWDPGREEQSILVDPAVAAEHRIAGTRAIVRAGSDGTMTAVVYVFGEEG